MNVSKDLVAASATPLILAILKENDSYGYAIIKRVKEMSENQLIWTEGMLYPVLHRLEEHRLIESYSSKSEAGRQRKYYRIKESGLTELELQKKQWEIVHNALDRTWNEESNS
ncbi:PadR family transcriptional regulator [Desulfosporosinus shakirovi]|uniref:PadR family transcriptional regulator n=1 Tax=Desulfosporosinus shakirovi TaxID=2885154 RepID=UPI001E2F5F18|nr:PadR family transcriptional regulator [Desulfosporosinus sp. SRJS8]MCB8817351.1 PadR family transcriptional regulator [Desulfosporosinus sp. SRJS8]